MKINKSTQGKLINSIAGKLVKIASMDVYVQGFDYPKKLDTLGDLSNDVTWKLPYKELPPDEKKEFDSNRVSKIVTPDGDDYFKPNGVINFYTSGLRPERVQEWLNIILNSLKEDGAEKVGPIKTEKSNMFKGNVIRIPVGNVVKKEQIRPPELNMANANAMHIFQGVLKYQFGEGFLGDIDANDLIKRIDYYLAEKQLPETPNRGKQEQLVPWVEGVDDPYQKIDSLMGPMKNFDPNVDEKPSLTTYHGGYDDADVRDRLQQIRNIAQWALKNGYPKLSVY